MPKKLINDYIFYKIVCLDDSIDLCYIGSTANWKQRQRCHKNTCNNEKSKKYNTKVYKTIRANGGWCNFKMIEIGKTEQLTVRQAEKIEEYYRVELKASMNDRRCYVSEEQKREYKKENGKKYRTNNKDKIKEYHEANKEYFKEHNKEWREANREYLLEQKREYYKNNIDEIKQQQKEYSTKNKDKIKEYKREYSTNNKDKIKAHATEKISCQCGCQIRRGDIARHKKSKKHINLMLG